MTKATLTERQYTPQESEEIKACVYDQEKVFSYVQNLDVEHLLFSIVAHWMGEYSDYVSLFSLSVSSSERKRVL